MIMNKVSSDEYMLKDEKSKSTDGKISKLQETVCCQSTGDSSFVISCKENVSEHINQNASENFTIPS